MTSSPKMRNIISSIKENHDSVMIKSCKNRIDKTRIEENREDNNTPKKETLLEQFKREIKLPLNETYENIALDFISYRKLIKKPLKTIAPIKLYINSLIELENLGYSFEYCIEQMKANEWQTVKKEYIHKPNKPQQKTRAESNREFIEKHYGINEDGNIIDTEII